MDLEGIVSKFKVDGVGAGGEGLMEKLDPPDALEEYVEQITNTFTQKLQSSKLEYYLGLTFPDSETDGLLAFLKKAIIILEPDKKKLYEKTKERIFELIRFILSQRSWKTDVNRFCERFKVI